LKKFGEKNVEKAFKVFFYKDSMVKGELKGTEAEPKEKGEIH